MGLISFSYIHICQGGFKVKTFDVSTHVLSLWRTNHAVPQEFGCGEVCCAGGEFIRIIYQISAHRDPHSVWVILLGAIVYDYPRVGDCAAGGNLLDLFMCQKFNCVCAFLPTKSLRYIS